MRAVVYDGPRDFTVREVPTPEPGPGEVRLRSTITGVCGTDWHIHDGGFFSTYPLIPGHEIVGVVDALGPGADAGLVLGQQVVADNTQLCGECHFCRRDQPLFCRHFRSLGVNAPGGLAEYLVVPVAKCFDAADLPADVAVMTEPTACAVHGMDVLDLRPESDVLLFGAGPTGLVLAQLLVHGGSASVTVAAPTRFKLDLAEGFGIDRTVQIDRSDPAAALDVLKGLASDGFDAVIEAAGVPTLMERCPELVKDGGTFMIYGMAGEDDRISLSPYEIFKRELTVRGSFAQTHNFDRALAVLRSGRVKTEGIVTHRFPLDAYGDALAALRSDPTCLKASIVQ
jgi:D-arabinitol dehydrogenase (NADP+)